MHLTGLVIRTEDPIAPTIYLEDFVNDLNEGKEMGEVLTNIADIYTDAMENAPTKDIVGVDKLTDFEETKDKIVARVINHDSNEERLKDMPHTDIGDDLAVTYHISLGSSEDGSMSVPITNALAEKYGVDEGKLFEIANENMGEINPSSFKSMGEVMLEMMVPDFKDMSPEEKAEKLEEFGMPDGGMYVLTNEEKNFGAAAMLDTETMDKIHEELGECYILPSSVHEVLLVPKSSGMELSDLEKMVQEVNQNEVSEKDFLSDHVYEYDKDTKELFRADRAEEHQKSKEASKEEAKAERPSLKDKLAEKKDIVKQRDANKDKSVAKNKDKNQSL